MIALAKSSDTAVDLATLTTDELRGELANALGLTAKHLLYLAAVWRELEGRGEDLSDLRSGIGVYLPAIAAGTVLPEAVVKFAGQPTLLRAVTSLVPHEQKKLVEGGAVPVVVKSGDSYSHRMLPAHALTATQVRQVFGERTVRTEREQIALLSAPPPKWKKHKPIKRGSIEVDPVASTIRVGRSSAALSDMIDALVEAGLVDDRRK